MTDNPVATAHGLLAEAVDALSTAAESGAATDAELLSALTLCEGLTRRLDRLTLTTIATLQRRGAFAERGYKSTAGALSDLLGPGAEGGGGHLGLGAQCACQLSLGEGDIRPLVLAEVSQRRASRPAGRPSAELMACPLT